MFAAQRLCTLSCFVLCRQIRWQLQPSSQRSINSPDEWQPNKFNTPTSTIARHKTAPQAAPTAQLAKSRPSTCRSIHRHNQSVRTATSQQNAAMSAPCGILEPLAPAAPRSRHAHRARCPLFAQRRSQGAGRQMGPDQKDLVCTQRRQPRALCRVAARC